MARPPKPLEVHRANGNPGRRPLPEVSLAGTDKPLGGPPRGLTADGRRVWNRLGREGPWLNRTHRELVVVAVECALRYRMLEDYFRARGEAAVAAGGAAAEGLLDDDGKRKHPLVGERNAAAESYRGLLGELGLSPKAQAGLLRYVDSVMKGRDAPAASWQDDL